MEKNTNVFGNRTVADGQTAASEKGRREDKVQTLTPESAFGWVLIGSALGRLLIATLTKKLSLL